MKRSNLGQASSLSASLRHPETGWKSVLYWLVLLLAPLCAAAQSYSIDWFTIDGGGGTSSGGNYTLTGSMGQPDAGRLAGGNYRLEGGFWPGLIVPSTTGAPTLFIRVSGATITISWAPASPGFSLEHSSTLRPGSWGAAPSGEANPATIPLGAGPIFYRLRKP